MHTPLRTTVLATALALVLVGCTGGAPSDPALPTPDSTPTTSLTTSPTTTSAPTPPGRGDCPAAEAPLPPPGATDVSLANADVDGDGQDDRVAAYRRSDSTRKVAVELATGATASVDASESTIDGPAPLSILGGVDLGGDGETVLAVTGGGASVVIVGLFQFGDCALTQVRFPSGQPVELPVGGAVVIGDGVACSDSTLIQRSAVSSDGETFATTDTRYRVEGNTLVEVGTDTATRTRESDDAGIQRYYTLDCPGLERGL